MPKTKTSSSAKKRFKVTGTGKLLRRRAMQSHNLTKKTAKRKRGFGKDNAVNEQEVPRVEEDARPEGGLALDASRQAIGRRAQEATQGSRPGEGLLGAEEVLVPLRQGAGRALARPTPTATARTRSGRSGGSGSCGSTRGRARTGSRTTSSSPASRRPRSSSIARSSPTSPSAIRKAFGAIAERRRKSALSA